MVGLCFLWLVYPEVSRGPFRAPASQPPLGLEDRFLPFSVLALGSYCILRGSLRLGLSSQLEGHWVVARDSWFAWVLVAKGERAVPPTALPCKQGCGGGGELSLKEPREPSWV